MEWVRLSLAPGWQLVSGMCMGAASRDGSSGAEFSVLSLCQGLPAAALTLCAHSLHCFVWCRRLLGLLLSDCHA